MIMHYEKMKQILKLKSKGQCWFAILNCISVTSFSSMYQTTVIQSGKLISALKINHALKINK